MAKIGDLSAAYIIRNKETGKQWVARSGKKVWAKPGHAKLAWTNSGQYHAERTGMPTKPKEYRGRMYVEVLKFDEQDKFELVKLETASTTATALLSRCLGRLNDSDLEQEITQFLEQEGV